MAKRGDVSSVYRTAYSGAEAMLQREAKYNLIAQIFVKGAAAVCGWLGHEVWSEEGGWNRAMGSEEDLLVPCIPHAAIVSPFPFQLPAAGSKTVLPSSRKPRSLFLL